MEGTIIPCFSSPIFIPFLKLFLIINVFNGRMGRKANNRKPGENVNIAKV